MEGVGNFKSYDSGCSGLHWAADLDTVMEKSNLGRSTFYKVTRSEEDVKNTGARTKAKVFTCCVVFERSNWSITERNASA